MLEIRDLTVGYYEDLHILRGLDLKAENGKLTAILGANGVGKSTLLKAIYGFLKPHSGAVLLNGRDVTGTPTYQLIDLGISYIPAHVRHVTPVRLSASLVRGRDRYSHFDPEPRPEPQAAGRPEQVGPRVGNRLEGQHRAGRHRTSPHRGARHRAGAGPNWYSVWIVNFVRPGSAPGHRGRAAPVTARARRAGSYVSARRR